MAYPITTTAGATLATISDGTVNTTATSLTLIGKNYAGYGNFLNENYVALLENFANSTAPVNAITGQLWFDNATMTLKLYNGSLWKPISTSASSAIAPVNPITGDQWWDNVNSQLKVWGTSSWITVGPSYTSSGGTSGVLTESITDSSGSSHVAVKFYISNVVIGIISKDSAYTPQSAIPGFSVVNPGFNLVSSNSLTGSQFTGDVSNALTLQGVNASQFLRSDQNTSTAYTITAGGGLNIGSDILINTSSGTEANIANQTLNKNLNFYVNAGGTITRAIGIFGANASVTFSNAVTVNTTLNSVGAFTAQSTTTLQGTTTLQNPILPNATGTINIGAAGTRFATVYGTAFSGNVVATGYVQTAAYATTSARDTALPTPAAGSMVFVTADSKFYGYTGSGWTALN